MTREFFVFMQNRLRLDKYNMSRYCFFTL